MTRRQIKSVLKRKGMTQVQLAKLCGVSETTMSFFVRGMVTSAPLERKVARLFGMSVAEFRGEEKAA